MSEEFVECASCAKQSGTPTLCASCLHNRSVIAQLKTQLNAPREDTRKALETAKSAIWDKEMEIMCLTKEMELIRTAIRGEMLYIAKLPMGTTPEHRTDLRDIVERFAIILKRIKCPGQK